MLKLNVASARGFLTKEQRLIPLQFHSDIVPLVLLTFTQRILQGRIYIQTTSQMNNHTSMKQQQATVSKQA